MVQCLRPHTFNAGDAGLISSQGTKILHALWCGQKIKKAKQSAESKSFCLASKTLCGLTPRLPSSLPGSHHGFLSSPHAPSASCLFTRCSLCLGCPPLVSPKNLLFLQYDENRMMLFSGVWGLGSHCVLRLCLPWRRRAPLS